MELRNKFFESVSPHSSSVGLSKLSVFFSGRLDVFPKGLEKLYELGNGLQISDSDFEFVFPLKEPFGQREDLRFSFILPVDSVLQNFNVREGVSFPTGTIPFVDVELGEIVVSYRHDCFGEVFFCEGDPLPEQMTEDSFEDLMQRFKPDQNHYPNTILKLADSIDEFLDLLTIEEW